MKTFAEIISSWPSAEIFADDIGLKWRSHGRVMKLRNTIPPRYWDSVIVAAERRNIKLSLTDLERAAEMKAHREVTHAHEATP